MKKSKLVLRLAVAIVGMFLTSLANAQMARYDNVVLSTNASGSTVPVPGVQIQICHEPSSGTTTSCTPVATDIYSDYAGTNVKSNPFNADSQGNFSFFAPPGSYRIQVVNNGVYTTLQNVSLASPTAQLGLYQTLPFATTLNLNAGVGGIFNLVLTGNVSSTTISNPTIGEIIAINVCQDAVGGRTFTWPTNVLLPPVVPTGANACTGGIMMYYSSDLTWHQMGGSGGGAGGSSSGLLIANTFAGLPSVTNTNLYIAGNFGSGVLGKIYVGDGTGTNSLFLSSRTAGADTDLFSFGDNGVFNILSAGNGYWDFASTAAGASGAAGNVRYTACANLACISENAGTPVALLKSTSAAGALTANFIPKASNGSTLVNSAMQDNGTSIVSTEPIVYPALSVQTNDVTITNTASVATTHSYSGGAGQFNSLNRWIKIRDTGYLSTTATGPTLTLSLTVVNVVTLSSSGAFTLAANLSQVSWAADCDLFVTTVGASGVGWSHCTWTFGTATPGASTKVDTSSITGNTVDWTAAQGLAIRATWGTANAGNTLHANGFTLQQMN